ncbi:hypothetical protein BMW23_0561 [Bodo saltans virus]|uniref:DUF7796 domain-containing protein n=1 Tax=Bodo saltans virus TaxID=2024608 RepID=A0A2H4UUM1_9VIRU|nr:hypothetical protein QJ851_gp0545 [Bodo saltans virus]ATZ80608.1 hypothetical protein BMW23_0561 [Bodo saltans virus]
MKIALCLSGLPRFVEEAYTNIFENLIEPNNADVFLHTWTNDKSVEMKIIDLYKPKKYLIESQREFLNTNMNHDVMLSSYARYYLKENFTKMIYSSWYSVQQSNLLKEQYRLENDFTYDCVIRARFDTIFNQKVDCKNSNLDIINISCRDLPVNDMTDDRFAYSSNKNMNIYSNIFGYIDYIHNKRQKMDGIFCGETLVYEALKYFDIKCERVNGLYCIQNSFVK